MSDAAALDAYAQTLRMSGLTDMQVFRLLRRANPHAERDTLVNAARLEGYRRGVTPGWAERSPLHPVVARWQPKGRPETPVVKSERKVIAVDYPLITIEARELRKGDWIDGEGLVQRVGQYSTMVLVWYQASQKFFRPREAVVVRLEDHGQGG